MRSGSLSLDRDIEDYTVNGECSKCGNCCTNYIPVSKSDIKNIRRYIKKHNIKPIQNKYPLKENVLDITCPMFDKEAKECTIYPVRPAICRDFKCNQPYDDIIYRKELYHIRYDVIDMKTLFE